MKWFSPIIDAKPLEVTLRPKGRPRRVTSEVIERMKELDGTMHRSRICELLGIHRNAFVQHVGVNRERRTRILA